MGYMQKGIVLMLALGMAMPVNAAAAEVSHSVGKSVSGNVVTSVVERAEGRFELDVVAKENDSAAELEAKLRTVKSRINIPDSYKNFEYYQNSYGDKVSYEFSWNNGATDTDWRYIGISITDNFISRYWLSQNKESGYNSRFGRLSKEAARGYADTWIKRVNPEQYASIRIMSENAYSDLQAQTITFPLSYEYDGVTVYNMNGSITVSAQNGEVSNFYMDWQEIKEYPDKSKALTAERAKEQFAANIGLKPVYRVYSDGYGNTTSFITYVQKQSAKVINALTGEAEDTTNYYMLKSAAQDSTAEAAMDSGASGGGNVRLSPAEQEKLEQTAGLISLDEAEKIARSNKYTEIPTTKKLTSSTLEENRYEKGRYQWHLSFMGTSDVEGDVSEEKLMLMIASGESNSYVNVTLDAVTGEFMGLNRYNNRPYPVGISVSGVEMTSNETQYDKYKDFAQTAFKSLVGKKSSEYKLVDTGLTDSSYSFARYVNGIEFPDNSFSMSIDKDGKISYMGGNYYNISFANPNGLIGEDAALKAAFEAVPYRMIYDVVRNYYTASNLMSDMKPRLLYTWEDSGFQIDARTGKVVDYRGKEVTKQNYSGYEGLDGNAYKDEINKLGEHGIYIRNTTASIDSAIIQKDFMSLCANVFWGYHIDESYLYERLIREGIIKSHEKAPELALTRDHIAKYLAAFMKIEEYSNLDGIFVKPYEDVASNVGSIAILKALKVIDITGDFFEPGKTVTNAEAIHYLYNYMSR